MKIMNYEVFTDELESLNIDKRQIINTINPHSFITSLTDKKFAEALNNSDILLPDGSGIVLATKWIKKIDIKKISGSDLHLHLLNELNKIGGRVFYMGASENTLKKIENRIFKEYPNIIVKKYSPPFKSEFSFEDNKTIISKINNFNPDVLFIGLTAPKQEKWLYTNKNNLNFKIATSIGAVFDFYAGTVKRPSQFWINMHLEWLLRFLQEPKRLWRRNFISTPLFLIHVLLCKINKMEGGVRYWE